MLHISKKMIKTNLLDLAEYQPGLIIRRRLQYSGGLPQAKRVVNRNCLVQDSARRRIVVFEFTSTVDKPPRLNRSGDTQKST